MKSLRLLLLSCFVGTACSTFEPLKPKAPSLLKGALLGALIGKVISPQNESPNPHIVYSASLGAIVAWTLDNENRKSAPSAQEDLISKAHQNPEDFFKKKKGEWLFKSKEVDESEVYYFVEEQWLYPDTKNP